MILMARHMDCQYIWHAHSARARQQGVSNELVDALRDRKPLPAMPADEAALVAYASELFNTHRVSAPTFKAALEQFGTRWLTELATMMGYYTLLSYNANSFEIDLPEGGAEPELPV